MAFKLKPWGEGVPRRDRRKYPSTKAVFEGRSTRTPRKQFINHTFCQDLRFVQFTGKKNLYRYNII